MNKNRLNEIAQSTGMSLDQVASIQLDEEPFPGKYVTKRIQRREVAKQAWRTLRGSLIGASFSVYFFINILPMARSANYLEAEFRRNPDIGYFEAVNNVKKGLDRFPIFRNKVADTFLSKPGEYIGYVIGGMRHAFDWKD